MIERNPDSRRETIWVDVTKAWYMAHAEEPYRNRAHYLDEELKKGKGITLYRRGKVKQEMLRQVDFARQASAEIETTIDFYREVKRSPQVRKFHDWIDNNALKVGNSHVTEQLARLRNSTAEELFEEYGELQYFPSSQEQSIVLAHMTAGLSFALVDKKPLNIPLVGSKLSIPDWDSQKCRIDPEQYKRKRSVPETDLLTIENAYLLLGLGQMLGDIPEVLDKGNNRFSIHSMDQFRYRIADFGLHVAFQFFYGREQITSQDRKEYLPARVDLIASRTRP